MTGVFTALLLLFAPTAEYPKRYTERITITAAGHTAEIAGEAVHRRFGVGAGPGNSVNGVESRTGWIISDWLAEVPEPGPSLRRCEVVFHITVFKGTPRETRERYVASYAHDPGSGRGYVRLPGRGEPNWDSNSRMISRGDQFEGHWFVATDDWARAVESALRGQ